MNLREYQAKDKPFLEQMHRFQGFDYELPELDAPNLWVTRMVLTDAEDQPVSAILGRITSEAYFLDYPTSPNLERMRNFVALHELACEVGRRSGIDSTHVWLPPEVEKSFGEQLEKLGWEKFMWASYMKSLEVTSGTRR